MISENTAKISNGVYVGERFADLMEPGKEETRTPEEIIEDIRRKSTA